MEYISYSCEQTEEFAYEFAKALKPNDVIALFGDLGAGKTAFVRGVARGLNVDEYITSPTFVILNEYEGKLTLYHFDMYRLEGCDEDALVDVGYFDCLYSGGVCAIEWSEYIEDFLPNVYYKVTMCLENEGEEPARRISIEKVGEELC